MRVIVVPALAVGLLLLGGGAAGEEHQRPWCGVKDSGHSWDAGAVWSAQSLEEAGFEDEVDLSGKTAVIDILFLYTEEAERYWREEPAKWTAELRRHKGHSLREAVGRLVDEANAMLLNSGTNARLRMVGLVRGPASLDEIEDNGNDPEHVDYGYAMHVGVGWVRRHADAIALRDRYGADLVYLVMGGNVRWQAGVAGRPWELAAIPEEAAGALQYASLLTVRLLAHEVGHNLGLAHQRGEQYSSETTMRPGGRGFVGTGRYGRQKYSTIMANGPRASIGVLSPFYSTSSATGNGLVLGLPGEHEAVAAARFAAPYLAAVRRSKHVEDPGPHGCRGSGWSDCVGEGRFRVEAEYGTADGQRKPALIREAYLGDSGTLFYFYSWENPELLVKVLDGCGINGHYWVFGSAATDREYVVRVSDLRDGAVQQYGRGPSAPLIAEVTAFPCGGVAQVSSSSTTVPEPAASAWSGTAGWNAGAWSGAVPSAAVGRSSQADGGDCFSGWFKDCVVDGRFGTKVKYWLPGGAWEDEDEKWKAGTLGIVRQAVLGDNASLFYFFNWENPELLIKVVDGCAMNGHYWVFGSAASDLEYLVKVYDYRVRIPDGQGYPPGTFRLYERDGSNPLIADTTAFRCELD